ncbi:hypothetical protein Tco_0628393 [Tanacetum coccineum]|uniref:Uncharacterized protein n=1 Tax=Tanacetum coccineum TaxID=301880 RepID=A0ABQ4WQ67_9ASTR
MMIQDQEEVGKGLEMPTDPHHTPTIIQPLTSQTQMKQRSRRPKRKDTQVPRPSSPTTNVADEVVNKEMDDSLVRASTTASSLEAEQESGNIDKTQSKATPNESSSLGTSSCGGPRRQETMSDTIAQTRVLALETTKTTQANEIVGLKRRVKKLERRNKSRTHGLKRLYKGRRIHDIDADEDITLINDDNEMFDVGTLTGDEVLAEQVVAAKDVNLSVDEATLAQALAALKSAKGQEKGDVIKEPSVPVSVVSASTKDSAATTTTTATIPTLRKGIDDIHAKIEADHELAQRLQAQEQEELSDAEKATIFVQLLEKRRKHFAVKRVEEKRNKPPTQAQQRKIMCTYLKNMEGKKPKDLKNKSFDSIQKMFDRAFKRVNTFIDFRTDLVEGNEEEVALDAIPLATKSPSIVDWKIHKEGKKSYYQIIKADGSSKMYLVFSHMLKRFDREDLKTLYKLIKAKYGSTRPVEDLDLVLYGDLKTMFKPYVEDNVWKNQLDYRLLDWKLYDSCGVHSLRKQNVHIHMLVEKRYPLTAPIIIDMLNNKLQCDHFSEMAYQLLKLLTK